MRITRPLLVLCVLVSASSGADLDATLADAPLQLVTTDGETLTLSLPADTRLTVLCFLGTECPLARLYAPRLQALADAYESQGVRFIAINSNQQDSLAEIRESAQSVGLKIPVCKDYDQAAADRLGIERTPEVCVLDAQTNVIYRGRVDDQYHPGVSRPQPSRHDLQVAIDEALAGQPVSVPVTTAVGCRIGRTPKVAAPTTRTFCRDVSRILQRHCVECHRAGDIGPFALTDYDEVTGWGETLLEVIADGRMPPWHASDASVPFVNARAMPEEDRTAIEEWVRGGMPYGTPDELPEALAAKAEWSFDREPDLIVPMRSTPFTVPAEGVVEYQYFVADTQLIEDKWVIGAEVIPGARTVVHHVIVFIRPPDGTKLRGMGWLTAYVPGQRLTLLPPGMGRRIPAGSRLVFQMHYTPNGSEQQDLSKLGLLFGDEEDIREELFTLMAINQNFEIPPARATTPCRPRSTTCRRRGSCSRCRRTCMSAAKAARSRPAAGTNPRPCSKSPATTSTGSIVYALSEPLELRSIDAFDLTARFDNSAANPVNPDPAQYVHWGDQTWEEMAIAFFEVAVPRDAAATRRTTAAEPPSPELIRTREQFVTDFFTRFDDDEDGSVNDSEVPLALKRYGFRKLDLDGDGLLSRGEVEELAGREKSF